MSTLVIAEHDNNSLKGSTLNTVAAANALSGDVVVSVSYTHLTLPTNHPV